MNEIVVAGAGPLNPVVLFSDKDSLSKILDDIKQHVMAHVPDVSTAKGRKEIASIAYKVAQSKTVIDAARKDLVAEWKEKAKRVDEEGKRARDFLDNLKDEVRKPLTAWEEEEAARIAKEEEERKYQDDWNAAIVENELFNLRREVERERQKREAEEAARAEKERLEREEKERIEREERIAREAKEKAEREAKEKIEQERIAAAERIAKERAEAERKAEEAERKRLADIKAAEEKAEAEKQAIIKAQEEKERAERERIAKEKAIEEKRQANLNHRKKINNEAKQSFMAIGFDETVSRGLVEAIANGKIQNVSIAY